MIADAPPAPVDYNPLLLTLLDVALDEHAEAVAIAEATGSAEAAAHARTTRTILRVVAVVVDQLEDLDDERARRRLLAEWQADVDAGHVEPVSLIDSVGAILAALDRVR